MTIGFDLGHDLDLEFSRSNMEFPISQPKVAQLPRNKKQTYRLNPRRQMWPMSLTLAMTVTFEFSRSNVILTIWWSRSGVRIYQIMTGVTSDVGVPSTHLVFSCTSVRPSVCLWHLYHHVPVILSSRNFQELLPLTKVMSMQKVKVRGQRSRSWRSWPHLAVSGL